MGDFILRRIQFSNDCTIGELVLGAEERHVCWVCEDPVREIAGQPVESWKIKGSTAIPTGRYQIKRTWSNRFQATMPQLLDVPGFEGIRIHPGNTSADTEGCLLPGVDRLPHGVGESRVAFREVLAWLDTFESQNLDTWIQVVGVPSSVSAGIPTGPLSIPTSQQEKP
jgi:hypothetical protein